MRGLVRSTVVIPLLTVALTGCPHTRKYLPVKGPETEVHPQAQRTIYPDDVRKELSKYQETLVVWPGIITERSVKDLGRTYEVSATFEHHYYDWLEDFSIQKEKIFLSPTGEGSFQMTWRLLKKSTDTTVESAMDYTRLGTLGIAYGTPKSITPAGVVELEYKYIRLIGQEWYSTKIFQYGREPIKEMIWLEEDKSKWRPK
jgi:hypothetical protein